MKKENHLKALPGDQVVSINDRKRLSKIQEQYPKLEIIIGKVVDGDEPVHLDMGDMDKQRTEIFDAATQSIFGERVDKLDRERRLPTTAILMLASFLAGIGACFLAYNL